MEENASDLTPKRTRPSLNGEKSINHKRCLAQTADALQQQHPCYSAASYTTILCKCILILFIIINCLESGCCAYIDNNNNSTNNNNIIVPPNATTNTAAADATLLALPTTNQNNNNNASTQTFLSTVDADLRIIGFRVEASNNEIEYEEDGVPVVLAETDITIRIFGRGLTIDTAITFTETPNVYGGSCLFPSTLFYKPKPDTVSAESAVYTIKLPNKRKVFYICAKHDDKLLQTKVNETKPFVHQGDDVWFQIRSYENLLPLWASIAIIVICLSFSALFSGLNLGLMSLDKTELKILCNTGTDRDREYAKKIMPVREQGNYLLCSILLGNVLVNSIFTILLDGLTSGMFAVIFSTVAIVLMGEITPQAVCSRHGLAIGANTILITKTVMFLTFPLSYPTSRMLDWLLGEEISNVYNRDRIKELVRVNAGINDLDKNEVNIISGALELRKKTVADVMTHIEDAFMLSLEAILDFHTVSEIMKSGFSRIPVYDGEKKNIVTLLYIKDLAFVDPDDNTPLRTLCEFYQNPVHFVFEDYTLDVMFNQFKDGTIGHIAFVHRVNNEGDGDPFYETIGLVTLEDVIEELIQAEIVDETDVFVDNRTKIKRARNKKQDFSVFAERRENQHIRISPQLTLATFQYLSTSVDAFKKEVISEPILRRLLNQDIIHSIKCKGKDKNDPSLFIFQQGKAVDFFVLILEGRVEVTVGKENLLFDSGPFTYFGTQALVPNVVVDSPSQQNIRGSLQSLNMDSKIRQTFVPDYSVRASTDVIYIAIKRSLYLTAKKATLLEKTRKAGNDPANEAIDDEVEKLLHSLSEDDKQLHRLSRSIRKTSAVNGSNTASPSINEFSQQSRSAVLNAHLNSQGSNSADMIDDISFSSQITSDPANDHHLHNHHPHHHQQESNCMDFEKETSVPLLPRVLPGEDMDSK